MNQAICALFTPLFGSDKNESEWKHYVERSNSSSKNIYHGQTKELSNETENVSPFVAYEDGFLWPDLYSELDEMMETCTLIYALVELRRKARNKEFDDKVAKSILKLPLTHSQVLQFTTQHKDKILETKFAEEFYLQTLQAIEKRQSRTSPTKIIAVDDEYENEELVYTVDVSHVRKRVTVCFRGSVTKADWATNYEIYMKEVPNPVRVHSSQEDTVRIHNGFYDYMFTPNSRGMKGPEGEMLSEYQEILYQHVLPVLKKYPGYKLYVTGHSLGAALATLFAFKAAAESDTVVPKPVSLFSIAGPYVGDYSFRAAHQLLESLGRLRHLRVSNHKDFVTIIPKMSFRRNIFDSSSHVGSLFKHVGINLRLYEGTTPLEFTYPKVHSGYFTSMYDELTRGWEQSLFANWSWNPAAFWTWPAHGLKVYTDRAEDNRPSLEALHLNDLYARKDLVGNLVAEF